MVRVSSELTVPDGVGEGDILHVDIEGLTLDVPVPAGVASGETFVFEYERPDDATPASETWPPPESSWPSGDSLLMAAVRSRRLTPDNAQALTDIMEALYDADELDDYIDDHAAEFAAYTPDGLAFASSPLHDEPQQPYGLSSIAARMASTGTGTMP